MQGDALGSRLTVPPNVSGLISESGVFCIDEELVVEVVDCRLHHHIEVGEVNHHIARFIQWSGDLHFKPIIMAMRSEALSQMVH